MNLSRKLIRKPVRSGLLTLIVWCMIGHAQASVIRLDWSGSIVDPGFVPGVVEGDSISGTFVYETDISPTATGYPGFVEYYLAVLWHRFSVGGFQGTFEPQTIGISDNFLGSGDQFAVNKGMFAGSPGYTGDVMDGVTPSLITWILADPTGAALMDLSIPQSINLSDWDTEAILSRLSGSMVGENPADLTFQITGVTTSVVSSPSTLALMMLVGILAMNRTGKSPRRLE